MHKLSERYIRQLKPQAKRIRKSDGGGLYIIVEPNGKKYFALELKIDNKIRRIKIDDYPKITLKEARIKANIKLEELSNSTKKDNNSLYEFEYLAHNLIQIQKTSLKPRTIQQKEYYLNRFLIQNFKNRDIRTIDKKEIIAYLKHIEEQSGSLIIVKNLFEILNQLFEYNYIICEDNPMSQIKRKYIFKKHKTKHHNTLTEIEDIKKFITKLNGYKQNDEIVFYALKLMLLTALRVSNIVQLEWKEINLDRRIVSITKDKMKNNQDFKFPLSKQAYELLLEIKSMKNYKDTHYVFYYFLPHQHINKHAPTAALYRLGYKGIISPHSFRSMFSTICNEYRKEHNIYYDIIEKCLAHSEKNQIRASYNYAHNLEDMQTLFQWYADFLGV